jgi:DNA-binding response OmpR family regulator
MSLPKIIIVDDKPENLLALESLLEDMPAQTVRALSGNEALSMTLEYDFALMLLDIQMPGMDGFEVARLLRENSKTRHLPVIFISAVYSSDSFQVKGVESGAIDFIEKPIIPALLRGKVRLFLELYQYRQQQLNNATSEVVAQVSDGVIIINQSAKILLANPAAEKILKSDSANLLGSQFNYPLTPGELQEIFIPSAADEIQAIELNTAPIIWLDKDAFIISMRDVTEREKIRKKKRQIEKLKHDLEELQSISDLSRSKTSITAKMLGIKPLNENTKAFSGFMQEYGTMLELAIDQRVVKVDHGLSEKIRIMTEELIFLRAGPRDVIDIHTSTLKNKITKDTNPQKAQAYYDEARILVLELMGNLAAGYRKYSDWTKS